MSEELILLYIQKTLEYNKVKLECINLGYTTDKRIKIEIDMLKQCINYIKERR